MFASKAQEIRGTLFKDIISACHKMANGGSCRIALVVIISVLKIALRSECAPLLIDSNVIVDVSASIEANACVTIQFEIRESFSESRTACPHADFRTEQGASVELKEGYETEVVFEVPAGIANKQAATISASLAREEPCQIRQQALCITGWVGALRKRMGRESYLMLDSL